MVNLTEILALLEREQYWKNSMKATELFYCLEVIRSYTIDSLELLSKYSREDIERILKYWKGENE